MAPDDKIYFACAWNDSAHFNYPYPDSAYYPSNMNLSVINDPNVLGIGCNFSLYSFYLGGKRTYWGLPNNPDYSMGPVIGSICDSLSTGISDTEENEKLFSVYPNPANQEVTLYIPGREMADKYIHIIDSYGSMVRLIKWKANSSILTINMEDIKPGVYHVSLIINHERIQTDRLVVIH